MPLFSIVIPCYNDADLAVEAIESCLQQSEEFFEIIFVDDGSIDESFYSIQKLYRDNPKVIVCRKHNGGLSSARNFGLSKCSGEYIIFLDSDDLLQRDFLLDAKKIIQGKNRKMEIYVFPFSYFNITKKCKRSNYILRYRPPILGKKKYLNLLKLAITNCFPISAAVIPREIVVSNRGFDEELSCYEDWDFWLRLAKSGHTFFYANGQKTPSTLIRIRQGMSSDLEKMKKMRLKVFHKIFSNSFYMIFSVIIFGEFFRKILIAYWMLMSLFDASPNKTNKS